MFNRNSDEKWYETEFGEKAIKFVVLGVISIIVFRLLGLESVQKAIQWLAGIEMFS